MRKRVIAFIVMFLFACLMAGCQCEHQWVEANCTTAKTCTKCEVSEGDALGHNWSEATCIVPKTCFVCGITEGNALPHIWKAATCTVPETCSVCEQTQGEPSGHNWNEESTRVWKKCDTCKKEVEYYSSYDEDQIDVWTEWDFDSNGKIISLISYDAEADVFVKRTKCIEWIKDGQVQYWDSCQVDGFFWELYHVDGKIYYRVRSGGGAQRARRLVLIAKEYVDFRTYWYGDGDHIDLANSDDFWAIIDNPLGSAACAVDINGTKYVIVHKGDGDLNPLDTFAVQANW